MSKPKYVTALIIAASIALAGCSGASSEEPTQDSPSTNQVSEPVQESTEPAQETTEPEPESSEPAVEASELTADAATGKTFEGTGYSFTAPEGWEEITEGVTEAGLDISVADSTDTDGFADNVNVVLSPAGSITPEQVETAGVDELENAADVEVTVNDRVIIAGAESAHLSAAVTGEGVEYQVEQFYITPGDQTFIVSFAFSPSVSEADRNEVAQSVLVTWSQN